MKIDVLVAEIGSTTTIVNAFNHMSSPTPVFLGQGMAKTTTAEGDISLGLEAALADLKAKLKTDSLDIGSTYATSSAAGGLKMTVHGLVYDMTVKAAREAALGAGANLNLITAGKLTPADLAEIRKLNPNIIMIAGGVDYGEKETALFNAREIAGLNLQIPVLYAGNIANQQAVKEIFCQHEQGDYLYLCPNVYPKIDQLQVDEARKIIQMVFEEHITKAPGLEKIRKTITGTIMPTPGAVMKAAQLLQTDLGDLIVVDVGGATTDLHSVCRDSEEIARIQTGPEPFAKRTVEGDLGVFLNKDNLLREIGAENIQRQMRLSETEYRDLIENYTYIPSGKAVKLAELLAEKAFALALQRHAGKLLNLYNHLGSRKIAEGKDLTGVEYVIATGGALTQLPHAREIISGVLHKEDPSSLRPNKKVGILLDRQYLMASVGVLADKYPQAALLLLKESLG
jgi:uncharacterized protein (TIGR01319 family)